jgi:signal transduction histidine kinase
MQSRAKEMKAQIKIDSVIGEGTGMDFFLNYEHKSRHI